MKKNKSSAEFRARSAFAHSGRDFSNDTEFDIWFRATKRFESGPVRGMSPGEQLFNCAVEVGAIKGVWPSNKSEQAIFEVMAAELCPQLRTENNLILFNNLRKTLEELEIAIHNFHQARAGEPIIVGIDQDETALEISSNDVKKTCIQAIDLLHKIMTTTRGEKISVQPDYGKDDESLQPGVYAVAHNYLAGPAQTREAAMKALAGHLWDEGVVLPGDDVEASFFVWPPNHKQ